MDDQLLFDGLVFLTMGVWGVFHTWMAAFKTKRVAGNIFGKRIDRYYRLIFIGIAVTTLLPILAMVVFLPSKVLWIIPTPWRYLTLALQVLAVTGVLITVLQTDTMAFLGIKQFFSPEEDHEKHLEIKGFYKFVRHPMYFFSIVLLWLFPYMTELTLAWVIASTLYFMIGSIPEERKLLAKFGDEYRLYRKEVPWLIPGIKFRKD